MEDFEEDDHLIEFIEYYSTKKFERKKVHLVLNGDILDLVQTDVQGSYSHIQTEEYICKALQSILDGHKELFEALGKFAKTHKLSYVIGNHDQGMSWPAAQKLFSLTLGTEISFHHKLEISGIHIEHGHRFEAINTVPPLKMFIDGPNGQKILNLPWASLFCLNLLPRLKKERPYLDKVRPLSLYIKWSMFHDFYFFCRLSYTVIRYLIRTAKPEYLKINKNYLTNWRLLKRITIYPRYAKQAKRILKRKSHIHTVVMGHTHISEWRRFPEGKYYLNSGTWNDIPTVDAGLHENVTKLTYICIDLNEKSGVVNSRNLNIWQGTWKPFRAESVLLK